MQEGGQEKCPDQQKSTREDSQSSTWHPLVWDGDLNGVGYPARRVVRIAIEAARIHGLDAKVNGQAKVWRLSIAGVYPAKRGFPWHWWPFCHTYARALLFVTLDQHSISFSINFVALLKRYDFHEKFWIRISRQLDSFWSTCKSSNFLPFSNALKTWIYWCRN